MASESASDKLIVLLVVMVLAWIFSSLANARFTRIEKAVCAIDTTARLPGCDK
jgi:hypothetical protein